MIICNALLKYGYSNFMVEILEYCEPEDVISREQHYFDTLSPEYNILKVAGSRLGKKHSEETLTRLRLQLLQLNKGKGLKVEIFDLALNKDSGKGQAGFAGMITANSFMKREFGKKLIETFLPKWDLTDIIDTSGA